MKIRFIFLMVLLAARLLSHAQSSGQSVTSVRFKKDKTSLPLTYRTGANPVIEVMINGRGPYKFMFDTGASGDARLDIHVFEELKLVSTDSIMGGDGSGRNGRWFRVAVLDTLRVGNITITNPRAMIRDYNAHKGAERIDGVIGLAFFEKAVVELNFETGRLIITKGKLDKKTAGVMKIKMDHDIPVFTTSLGEKKIDVKFDTGNTGGLTFHSNDITPDMIDGELKVIGTARTVSNTFEVKEGRLKIPITIGDLMFEHPVVNINDFLTHANMGIRFSKQLNVAFDITNGLMKIEKFSPVPSAASQGNVVSEYNGEYEGGRSITTGADGFIYLQRSGGMNLKLVEKKKDQFDIESVPQALVFFVRDANNKIIALKTSGDGGTNWDTAKKN